MIIEVARRTYYHLMCLHQTATTLMSVADATGKRFTPFTNACKAAELTNTRSTRPSDAMNTIAGM